MRRTPLHPASSAGLFALRFRLLMSYHDLTLRDIAAATGSAVSTVGTWKNGRVPSSSRALNKLAEIFHVSTEYLLAGRPSQSGIPASENADKNSPEGILENFAVLVLALESNGSRPQSHSRHRKKSGMDAMLRTQAENHLKSYLDRAEREPGGVAHAWLQLRREFPLDLYERLR